MKQRKEKIIVLEATINADTIRAAARNAFSMKDVAIEVPVVDPRDLSCEDQIYGITLTPTNDKNKKGPDTSVHCAIRPIIVETLSSRVKDGYITVNGNIDIPKEPGKAQKVEETYFENQVDAKVVCKAVTEVELERIEEKAKDLHDEINFLKKQIADDRW